MAEYRKKKKSKWMLEVLAYSLGFLAWLSGLHTLQSAGETGVKLCLPRFVRHLFKVFLWVLVAGLVVHWLGIYKDWLLQASTDQVVAAFLVKSVVFLYLKVFWPRVFSVILPGLHPFFCPQCYQRQTFIFRPVSLQLGFFVTYLCRYCSCLVDFQGRQVLYPVQVSFRAVQKWLGLLAPSVLLSILLGYISFNWLWQVL